MFLLRILLLPFRLALALVGGVFRAGFRLGKLPFLVSGRAVRLLTLRGLVLLVVGLALGLLLAPERGSDLRARLRSLADKASPGGSDLAERVSFELAHAPRTWHLPQPRVEVDGGRVVLVGSVADDASRAEFERVAGAVPGVAAVDNRIEVAEPAGV